jgi:DNA-binding LacI/PurR family transcriptional regulator
MANRGTSVTLRDVALAAGVSITTVSRILNGRETGVPVREETRARIHAAANDLGYRPNLLARGLRGSHSSLLGVIARDVSDPFYVQVLRGVNEVARSRDYRIFLGHADYEPEAASTYGSMFERSHADGIIVIGDIEGGEASLDALARQHQSIVGVADRTDRRRIPGVYGDNDIATTLALDHLWALGHRHITCVSDTQTHDGRRRAELYESYLNDRGAGSYVQAFMADSPGSPEPGFRVGQEIFADAGANRPTAIWATSDTIAVGIMQAAFRAGIRIPQDLSIIGTDDIDMAAFTIPPLTTVSQHGEEMGSLAASLLFRMIDDSSQAPDVADIPVRPSLIVRESTRAPTDATDATA